MMHTGSLPVHTPLLPEASAPIKSEKETSSVTAMPGESWQAEQQPRLLLATVPAAPSPPLSSLEVEAVLGSLQRFPAEKTGR